MSRRISDSAMVSRRNVNSHRVSTRCASAASRFLIAELGLERIPLRHSFSSSRLSGA
ncbi:Uncharacterised protein [Mycobacteroides abscessus subsp. abscessus]|nr:Uncharacterised protein [Mycobacteroides abscessus subsp. abscessus]